MEQYNDDELVSKSELKREMEQLQEYGLQLMSLKPAELARLPLNNALLLAIEESRRITAHEARRRHAQFVGKLMREEVSQSVVPALLELKNPQRLRWLMDWQDRLVDLANARAAETLIDEMMSRYDATDRQQLRNLCRNIISARVDREAPAAKQEKYRRERKKLSDYLNSLEKNQLL
ncbi:MAG: ribosome biogenesis factor YjgA [Alcanivoracaceae bacterium]|nr:ribosome biogenesis factor YjgA [Alcanivoracaceae bacterium]